MGRDRATDSEWALEFLVPEDPMDKVLDEIRAIVANLRPGQSICVHRSPRQPKVGEPLFTVYTKGTVTLDPSIASDHAIVVPTVES